MKSLRKWFILPIVSAMLFSCATKKPIGEDEAKSIAEKILSARIYGDYQSKQTLAGILKYKITRADSEATVKVSVDAAKGYGHYHYIEVEANGDVITELEDWCWVENNIKGKIYRCAVKEDDQQIYFLEGQGLYEGSRRNIYGDFLSPIETAYATLSRFVEPLSQDTFAFFSFYSSGPGQLDLEAAKEEVSWSAAISFENNAPMRVEIDTLSYGIGSDKISTSCQFDYSTPLASHPIYHG